MKKLLLVAISILLCIFSYGQKNFYYKLKIVCNENEKASKIYVSYEIAAVKFTDSVYLDNEKFIMDIKLIQPVPAIIYTDDKQTGSTTVFLANNTLNVSIMKNSISHDISKLQKDFLFLTANDRIRPLYFPLYGELSAKNDTTGLHKLGAIFDSLKKDDISKSLDYFNANFTSLLSLYSFNRYSTFLADYSVLEDDFQTLPSWAKNSPEGKAIQLKIEGAKSAQINSMAKEFIQTSSHGKNISLGAFKGKYVLINFWASWCAPCRKEHPNLIKLYEQFKNYNFEVISVSLDVNKNTWLEAIITDKINWTNISDLKGQQNNIAVKYGVQAIPANFLIDPSGTIIDKNIAIEQLRKKLTILLPY